MRAKLRIETFGLTGLHKDGETETAKIETSLTAEMAGTSGGLYAA